MMLLLLLILCLLLAALIMLLLITLSVPIIKPIYLFRLVARDSIAVVGGNATVTATFGVWGYCISPLQASWVISLFLNDLVISALRIVSVLGVSTQTSEECSRMKLGYTFDSTVVNALQATDIANTLSRISSLALVLHPIACGCTLLAYLIALYTYIQRRHVSRINVKPSPRLPPILLFITTSLASILSFIAFAIDAGVVGALRKTVDDNTDGLVTLSWGNGIWLTLGAAIALVICLICQWRRFGCCGRRG